jgi:hypothetical protein
MPATAGVHTFNERGLSCGQVTGGLVSAIGAAQLGIKHRSLPIITTRGADDESMQAFASC